MAKPDLVIANPQLCKTYNDEPIDKTMILEPKLDGLRGLIYMNKKNKSWVMSRNGKPFWNVDHIMEEMASVKLKYYILDGELYTQDWGKSASIIRKQSEHPDRLSVRFHVWDLIAGEEWAGGKSVRSLTDRRKKLEDKFSGLKYVNIVEQTQIKTQEELSIGYKNLLASGYEGGILKDPASGYVLGYRNPGWMKLKPWSDADLKIVGAAEGQGKHQGRLGKFFLEGQVDWKGKTYGVKTECGTGLDDSERETYWEMWQNGTLAGKIIEVKFQDVTAENALRFPVFHRMRIDK